MAKIVKFKIQVEVKKIGESFSVTETNFEKERVDDDEVEVTDSEILKIAQEVSAFNQSELDSCQALGEGKYFVERKMIV